MEHQESKIEKGQDAKPNKTEIKIRMEKNQKNISRFVKELESEGNKLLLDGFQMIRQGFQQKLGACDANDAIELEDYYESDMFEEFVRLLYNDAYDTISLDYATFGPKKCGPGILKAIQQGKLLLREGI